jgi:metallo-beta-lactamase class B
MKRLLYILLLAILSLNMQAQTSRKTIKISDNLQLIQLSNNAWIHVTVETIEGFGKVSSNGVIYIQKGKAFLFDTPISDSLTEILVSVISDSLKAKVVGFVPNHWHQDCMGGLKYLQSIGIKTYANQLTIEEANKHNLPVPTHGFTESLRLNLSGKTIECWYPGPGHSKDNIVVWLPSEKVLFAGCMVKEIKANGPGNLSDADVKSWPETIEKVIKKYKNAQIVVPGHGLWGGPDLLNHTLDLVSNIR